MTASKRSAAAPSDKAPNELAVGLVRRFGWLAAVLAEMRQINARMHEREGTSRGRRAGPRHDA